MALSISVSVCARVLHCEKSCGLMREELLQTLRNLELRKKKLKTLLPFLEFLTWSLLKEDSKVRYRTHFP